MLTRLRFVENAVARISPSVHRQEVPNPGYFRGRIPSCRACQHCRVPNFHHLRAWRLGDVGESVGQFVCCEKKKRFKLTEKAEQFICNKKNRNCLTTIWFLSASCSLTASEGFFNFALWSAMHPLTDISNISDKLCKCLMTDRHLPWRCKSCRHIRLLRTTWNIGEAVN